MLCMVVDIKKTLWSIQKRKRCCYGNIEPNIIMLQIDMRRKGHRSIPSWNRAGIRIKTFVRLQKQKWQQQWCRCLGDE